MIKLPDVTLCAIDHAAHDLTRLALERCLRDVEFADVVVLSDKNILPNAFWHATNATDTLEACLLLWYVLPRYVKTSHYLYIQWDSWVINPAAWTDLFLQYDYIGAPWPEGVQAKLPIGCDASLNVGNGGFSLRSKRLAEEVIKHDLKFDVLEDRALCVYYRHELEGYGLKWPARELAHRFSAEAYWPKGHVPFGFHAAYNFPCALTPAEFEDVLHAATPYAYEQHGMVQLRNHLAAFRDGQPLPDWYGPIKDGWLPCRQYGT
jgi:hypothetical protein